MVTPNEAKIVLSNDSLLIGRYLVCKAEGELHWLQRWVEVHHHCVATFVFEGDAEPRSVYRLTDVAVEDEGDRCFGIHRLSLGPTVRQENPASIDHMDHTDDESKSCDGGLMSDDDDGDRVVFRCCDRIECLDMLRRIEEAIYHCTHSDVGVQVSPEMFGFVERLVADDDALMQRHKETELRNQALVQELWEHDVSERQLRDELAALNLHMAASLAALESENKSRLELQLRQLVHEKKEAVRKEQDTAAARIYALESLLDEAREQLRAATQQYEQERNLWKKRLTDLQRQIQQLHAKAAMPPEAVMAAFHSYALQRADHTLWFRHHLNSEDIARFALALKRAAQILAKIPGAVQFATEFGHHWPIVGRLIEVPVMLAEEDESLSQLLRVLKIPPVAPQLLESQRTTANTGAGACSRKSPVVCSAPLCGGKPLGSHCCTPFAIAPQDKVSGG